MVATAKTKPTTLTFCPCCSAPLPSGVIPLEMLADSTNGWVRKSALKSLINRAGRIVTIETLIEDCYGLAGGPVEPEKSIQVMMSRLRNDLVHTGWQIIGQPHGYKLSLISDI